MAADGSLITNTVSATFYSIAGLGAANAYRTTYLATANVLISCPIVVVKKTTTGIPTTFVWGFSNPVPFQAVGGLVTFRIWVVNPSLLASAFNVCVTDRLSDNTEYASPAPFAIAPWTWAPGGQWYGTGSLTNAPASWNPIVAGTTGQDVPFYLRWCLFQLGPGKSAYVEYAVRVL